MLRPNPPLVGTREMRLPRRRVPDQAMHPVAHRPRAPRCPQLWHAAPCAESASCPSAGCTPRGPPAPAARPWSRCAAPEQATLAVSPMPCRPSSPGCTLRYNTCSALMTVWHALSAPRHISSSACCSSPSLVCACKRQGRLMRVCMWRRSGALPDVKVRCVRQPDLLEVRVHRSQLGV